MWMKVIAGLVATIVLLLGAVYFYYLRTSLAATAPESGRFLQDQIIVDGKPRSFSYYQPETLQEKPALLFVLHGSQGNAEMARTSTAFQFDHVAQRQNSIVVYPNGYDNHWNDCRGSASYTANLENTDDPAFFTAMIEFFQDKYTIDPTRIFATGHSNGGHMVYRLAYEMPETFQAVAAISANLPVDENNDCQRKASPISVAIVNGTQDPINPYEGGLVEILGDASRGVVMSSHNSAKYWASLAELDGDGENITLCENDGDPNTYVVKTHWQADGGTHVALYTLHGSGHVIPSQKISFPRLLGGNAGDIEAAEEIWNFFNGGDNTSQSSVCK